MKTQITRAAITFFFALIIATSAIAQSAQPRQLEIATYYFTIEADVVFVDLTKEPFPVFMPAKDFRARLTRLVQEGKAKVISKQAGSIRVGETFKVDENDGTGRSEVTEIATGEYGDGEQQVALAVNTRKVLGTELLNGRIPSINRVEVKNLDFQLRNNSVAVVGGWQEPGAASDNKKGKKGGRLILFAVEVVTKLPG